MSWLFLTIISYLMLAVVNLGDKFVVDKLIKSGKAYAFAVGLFSAVVFVIAPWFLEWPGIFLFLVNIIAGAFFVFALWTMYEALKIGEASRVVVVIGGIIPIFTIIFSILFFGEKFSPNQWLGILFLLAGMIIISFVISRRKKWRAFWGRLFSVFSGGYNKKWIFLAIISALLYSLFFISTKYAYNHQEFLSSFIWIRGGSLLVVLLFLIDRKDRREIIKSFKAKPGGKTKVGKGFVLINQALGSVGFILQNYAVYLGPVAVINALQGIQYAFLLILGIFFTIFFPKILREDISRSVLLKKIMAIILIGIGLYFIAV
jgi:drug/metabolite transporter (DMT)-like permease